MYIQLSWIFDNTSEFKTSPLVTGHFCFIHRFLFKINIKISVETHRIIQTNISPIIPIKPIYLWTLFFHKQLWLILVIMRSRNFNNREKKNFCYHKHEKLKNCHRSPSILPLKMWHNRKILDCISKLENEAVKNTVCQNNAEKIVFMLKLISMNAKIFFQLFFA